MPPKKLIVIDDEPALAGFVSDVARDMGFEVKEYHSGALFKEQYDSTADGIVLDLMMPEVDGIEVIRFLSNMVCNAQLILISGFDSGVLHSAQKLASEHGLNIAGTLNKPFRYNELHRQLSDLKIERKSATPSAIIKPPTAFELCDALNRQELEVHYQPKVLLSGSDGAATEALVRWRHPQHGLLKPKLFIPTAEQHGLIDDITWVVLEQVMLQCRQWLDQGVEIHVAVNMSANTLKALDLPEKLGNMVTQHGLKPSQIILEITETTLMQELIKSLDILTRLRMRGFQLSIDDFGTGYSSLVQLHRAPFSEIKIDSSFVMEMDHDQEAETIVETIIMLGHKLNMRIVAEGVETESCHEKLRQLACNQAQGFLWTKPLPVDEVLQWYEKHS